MRRALIMITVVVAVTVALLALTATLRSRHVKRKPDIASVEKDIREHLPIGSSRSDVERFLDARAIGHTYTGKLDESPEYSHTEGALIRGSSQSGLVRGDIQILFKFDNTDSKLVSYMVSEIFTGP